MITHDFEGSTHHFGPPKGMEDRCGWLHVFHNGTHAVSAWKPSPEDLARLNAGESVFLSVRSGSTPEFVPGEDGGHVILHPVVHPVFVGLEADTKSVVEGDGGKLW